MEGGARRSVRHGIIACTTGDRSIPVDDNIENSQTLPRSAPGGSDADEFPQGCQFSPDGLCVLTAQNNRLDLYNTPQETTLSEWKPALSCVSGDSVRSYAWYPHMSSANPTTCCFAAASRDQPVHLYDAYDGQIRASYRPYNSLDELETPSVVSFVEGGSKIVAGGLKIDRAMQIFDISRPGREPVSKFRLGATRRSKDGQKGLVSAVASSSCSSLLAVGTYAPGSIYLYDLRVASSVASMTLSTQNVSLCVSGHGKKPQMPRKRKHAEENGDEDVLDFSAAKARWYHQRTRSGVTQLEFVGDVGTGMELYSASRRSGFVLCWDLRQLSSSQMSMSRCHCPGSASFATDNDTNQRISFCLDQGGNDGAPLLWTGGRDGCVRTYDRRGKTQIGCIDNLPGVANGVSVMRRPDDNDKAIVAVAIGSRLFPTEDDYDDDVEEESGEQSATLGDNRGRLSLYQVDLRRKSELENDGKD